MALPKIVKAPASVLTTPCSPVEEIDPTVRKLVRTMGFTLRATKIGRGLAANQIGHSKRLFVYLNDAGHLITVVNPVILGTSNENITDDEGCLSIPGKSFKIERPKSVAIKFTDLAGVSHNETVYNFIARLFLHEIDHLDGKLIG